MKIVKSNFLVEFDENVYMSTPVKYFRTTS